MKLWLDDIREAPEGFVWAKSYNEAIALLKTGDVTYASLDHDLEFEQYSGYLGAGKTGYDVVCWMEENNVWPSDGTHCHSMNPVGRARIEQVINKCQRSPMVEALGLSPGQ